jgi:hypothetical protein
MPTEMESRMFQLLRAIEIEDDAPQYIESLGNEAVTVICEAALGSYPGIRPKMRANAVVLVGRMSHPQALETIALLVSDPDPGIAVRAMRAAGRKRSAGLVEKIARVLDQPMSGALLAAEALDALLQIDTPEAQHRVKAYEAASPTDLPHRRSPPVEYTLREGRKKETPLQR